MHLAYAGIGERKGQRLSKKFLNLEFFEILN